MKTGVTIAIAALLLACGSARATLPELRDPLTLEAVDAHVSSIAFVELPFDEKLAALDALLERVPDGANADIIKAKISSRKLFAIARVGDYEAAIAYLDAIDDWVFEATRETTFHVETLYAAAFIYNYAGRIEEALETVERIKAAPGFLENSLYRFYADNSLVAIYSSVGNAVMAADILIDILESGRINDLPEAEQIKIIANITFALVDSRQYDDIEKYRKLGTERMRDARERGVLPEIFARQTIWHFNNNFAKALAQQDRFDELNPVVKEMQAIAGTLGSPLLTTMTEFNAALATFGEGDAKGAARRLAALEETIDRLGSREFEIAFRRNYAKVLAAVGRHREAYESLKKSRALVEFADREQIRARSEFMDAQSDLQRKNIEIERLEAENRSASTLRRRDQLIAFMCAIGVVVLSVFALLLSRSKRRLEINAVELARSERKAQDAAVAKTAFLANMSHEIRTPLNGLMGMAQVLSNSALTDEQRESVEVIVDSGDILLTVVNDVLDLSKIEAGKMPIESVPTNIRSLLEQLVRLWSPEAAEKGLALSLRYDDAMPETRLVDPIRVRQCVSNLVSNAVKFTDRGAVAITACESGEPGARFLEIAVSDTGCGIADDVVERLFSAFEQADSSTTRRFGGTGLGLSITHKLANLMGGDVSVSSVVDEGTTFRLRIPSVAPAEDAAPVGDCAADATPSQRFVDFGRNDLRILLVDDNLVNRMVVKAFLEESACVVAEAGDGREALQRLDEASEPYDVVLLDMHMPVMDGPETVRRIRASQAAWRDVKIITLTADAMAGDRDKYIKLGTDGYLSKPVVKADLYTELARLITADRPAASSAA
ncbi:MAG: ATP-binding protein [Pseudomonadota bacterium]